ncbi:MAG: hypothetical protein MJZ85_06465 [Bacteroidales bacterium]|nr:hypothetical protein [Bacteroidales bacterium]
MEIFRQKLRNAEGNEVGEFAIISETGQNPNPLYNVQRALNQYVGHEDYNDFVEEWLDNPWIRVVVKGFNEIDFQPMQDFSEQIEKYEVELIPGNQFTRSKIVFLFANPEIENPRPIMESAVQYVIEGSLYNAFIDSHLDNPWIRIVVVGINNLPFEPYPIVEDN